MPKEFSRTLRVADQIQRSLAQLIQTQLADPRLGMVNINAVEVSRDYSVAKVYITVIGASDEGNDHSASTLEALNHAANYLRGLLAKSLNSRTTPRLIFVLDSAAIEGRKLSHLIDQAVAADRGHDE